MDDKSSAASYIDTPMTFEKYSIRVRYMDPNLLVDEVVNSFESKKTPAQSFRRRKILSKETTSILVHEYDKNPNWTSEFRNELCARLDI